MLCHFESRSLSLSKGAGEKSFPWFLTDFSVDDAFEMTRSEKFDHIPDINCSLAFIQQVHSEHYFIIELPVCGECF